MSLHFRRRDLCHLLPRQAAVSGKRDGDVAVGAAEEIDHPQVAERVPRQLLVAADVAQVIARADDLPGPGQAAVERDTLEQSYDADGKDGHRDDVRRVRRIDGDGILRVVPRQGADVDVRRSLRGRTGWHAERDE